MFENTHFLSVNRAVASLLISAMLLVVAPVTTAAPNLDSYEMVFNDEFNGASLDTSKWSTSPIWGPFPRTNNEDQYYLDKAGLDADHPVDPFLFDGSTLTIQAVPVGNATVPAQPDENAAVWNDYPEYSYSVDYDPTDRTHFSGLISSVNSFNFTHGYAEARVQVPAGQGLWPAFWTLTNKYVEDAPEIDIMEALGQFPNDVNHTMHYFDTSNNWSQISTPTYTTNGPDFTEQLHTFGMLWSPEEVTWFVDGVAVQTIDSSQYTIPKQAMYVIANLAVGGAWPGSPDATTPFPADYQIDYIRVYQRQPPASITAATLAADYQLMFADEFSGSSLDSEKWNTSFLWGPYQQINNEEQVYIDVLDTHSDYDVNPLEVSDGMLKITASPVDQADLPVQPGVGDPYWEAHPERQFNENYDASWIPGYTSGIVTSYDSFKFVHGYVEYRAKLPMGDGLWPAFWLLNGYYVGTLPEIDILEVQGEQADTSHHSYHYFESDGTPVSSASTYQLPTGDFSDGFHTFGVQWHPGKIVWYVDGNPVRTLEGPEVSLQLMYLIANLAVGGNFVGAVGDDFPATIEIDYVRAYQLRQAPISVPEPEPNAEDVLVVGVPDSGQYGWAYGTSVNEQSLSRTFTSTGDDLVLTATGFDIDFKVEVQVFLNNESLGYLTVGPNESLAPTTELRLPVASQLVGENEIRFVQTTPGFKWGVTQLLLTASTLPPAPVEGVLSEGVVDTGQYGWSYGTSVNQESLSRTFTSAGTDLLLSATGYDIDFNAEVQVLLNGEVVGSLSRGPDNASAPVTEITLLAADQLVGENEIRFVQTTPGYKWGVTQILLTATTVVTEPPEETTEGAFVIGVADTGQYGWSYGTSVNQAELSRTFESAGTDLLLSVTGYDIDFNAEVRVLLNDGVVGSLDRGPDNALAPVTEITLLAADQLVGENEIRFVQTTPGYKWGVTQILLTTTTIITEPPEETTDGVLVVDVADTGQYGWSYGTSANREALSRTFVSTGSHLTLSVTGYDIDFNSEVQVLLNDVVMDTLTTGPNNALAPVTQITLPAVNQLAGENEIRFVQATPGYIWGVTQLLLTTTGTTIEPPEDTGGGDLLVDVIDTVQYGWSYGTSVNREELSRTFVSAGDDLTLSVTGYDIDFANEVQVFLNDQALGFLTVGSNNALAPVTQITLPAASHIAGENEIRFEQRTPGYVWGVTQLLLEQI